MKNIILTTHLRSGKKGASRGGGARGGCGQAALDEK